MYVSNMGERFWIQDRNLDRFAELLSHELNESSLTEQIPDGAHIFHGSASDIALTQANLKLATRIFLGMILGYIEKAPLVMLFESPSGKKTVIDLASEAHKIKLQKLLERFQEQSQQFMADTINELEAA